MAMTRPRDAAAQAPHFFPTAEDFGAWLRLHGQAATSLLVGLHKRGSGTPCMTWPEAVDEALCAGWIDGVRKRIDDASYQIRFTPRKAGSIWSAVNIERVRVLTQQGRMTPAGLEAWARRSDKRSVVYSYEQTAMPELAREEAAALLAHSAASAFFHAQGPGYRKKAIWHVTSAKRADTRARRLLALIEASAEGRQL